MRKILMIMGATLLTMNVKAQLRLSNALQSRMVIQQNKPFKIWGKAAPGQPVVVKADWQGNTTTVTASAIGDFMAIVNVPSVKAGDFSSHQLSVSSGEQRLLLDSLLIGDLWFCSGQSNMQFALKEDKHAATELPKANYPFIRLLRADLNFSATPLDEFAGKWELCTPDAAGKFSAVGYSFGKELFQQLQVPIGLIFSGIGASAAQAYVPQEVLRADTLLNRAYLQPYLTSDKSKEKIDGGFTFEKVTRPFLLYNAMIHPFVNLSIKGFCWYQGESNRMERAGYTRLTQAMIEAWRKKLCTGTVTVLLCAGGALLL